MEPITKKTKTLNLTVSTAQKKPFSTVPTAEGLMGINSKMAIKVYDIQ